jgi:hypothetical protein
MMFAISNELSLERPTSRIKVTRTADVTSFLPLPQTPLIQSTSTSNQKRSSSIKKSNKKHNFLIKSFGNGKKFQ